MKTVWVNDQPREVEYTWVHGKDLIFKFKGVDSIAEAEQLAGADVLIPIEQRPEVPEGEYYRSDVIGCEVTAAGGRQLGIVADWQDTGGTPLLVVRTAGGRELLIPFAKAICTKIDVERKRIEVNLPEGLEDLNAGG